MQAISPSRVASLSYRDHPAGRREGGSAPIVCSQSLAFLPRLQHKGAVYANCDDTQIDTTIRDAIDVMSDRRQVFLKDTQWL